MFRSDSHLESALQEYNDKVSQLDSGPVSEELLEALVNRSSILLMMESYTSALEDCEDALEISKNLDRVDVGTFMKMYENHTIISYDSDPEAAVGDTLMMLTRLNELDGRDIRHYDRKAQICMCIDCASDLFDADKGPEAMRFIDKANQMLGSDLDRWSRNRKTEIENMLGEFLPGEEAEKHLDLAIFLGQQLYDAGQLDDPMGLVLSYVSRGDIYGKERAEMMWEDHERAAMILEDLYYRGRLEDTSLLVELHQNIATTMMEIGRMNEAEKHLMRAINLEIPGMKEAMEKLRNQ